MQIGGQFIPYQGYVNQWMDMVYNRGLFANAKYEGAFDWGNLEAKAFVHQVRHTMGFIAARQDRRHADGHAVDSTPAIRSRPRSRCRARI